jgi:hypothetical protein
LGIKREEGHRGALLGQSSNKEVPFFTLPDAFFAKFGSFCGMFLLFVLCIHYYAVLLQNHSGIWDLPRGRFELLFIGRSGFQGMIFAFVHGKRRRSRLLHVQYSPFSKRFIPLWVLKGRMPKANGETRIMP